jgi:hypothetical protein
MVGLVLPGLGDALLGVMEIRGTAARVISAKAMVMTAGRRRARPARLFGDMTVLSGLRFTPKPAGDLSLVAERLLDD